MINDCYVLVLETFSTKDMCAILSVYHKWYYLFMIDDDCVVTIS